jgi:hypothetical protein
MAHTSTDSSQGATVRAVAIAGVGVYTLFAAVAAFGGSDASYQGSLFASWIVVMLVALATYAIGASMKRRTTAVDTTDHTRVLTPVG